MKALLRGNEVLTEDQSIASQYDWIDWNTGMPLTSEHWAGGAYALVEDYVAPIETVEKAVEEMVEETGTEVVSETSSEDTKTVVINGQEFTKAELIEYINSL